MFVCGVRNVMIEYTVKYQGARRTFKKVVSFQVTAEMKMYRYRYTIFSKIKVNKEKNGIHLLKKKTSLRRLH